MTKQEAMELISDAIDDICGSYDPWGKIIIDISSGEVKHVDIMIPQPKRSEGEN
ncbi:MAG: hypothetical protein ABFD50_11595 [Smithella sp.]